MSLAESSIGVTLHSRQSLIYSKNGTGIQQPRLFQIRKGRMSAMVCLKRTNVGAIGLSAMCQKRPTRYNKQHRSSINSSA